MATPFNEIYPLFLAQITDYNLALMDDDSLDENMQLWLLGAIGYFSNCKHDLSEFNLDSKTFTADLNHMEKQILSRFMLTLYLDTHLLKEDLLKQNLNSKDYRVYSPANQLKALIETKSKINSEANVLMSRYSYNIHRLRDFFE